MCMLGTVDRIYDLTNKGVCKLNNINNIILDEADKILYTTMIKLVQELLNKHIKPNISNVYFVSKIFVII